jgi:hypothetical protein
VHWAAVSSGAVLGVGLALVAGSLWTAAAFSSHTSAFANHLAWWLGATLIGATFLAAIAASGLSSARGPVAGAANGLTTWGLMIVAAIAVTLVAVAANATTATVTVHGSPVGIDLLRPYVVFWSGLAALAAGGIGGVAGGLIPRRVSSATAAPSRLTASEPAPALVTDSRSQAIAS